MSITINAQTFDVGDTIRFSSINPKDTRIWYGTVVATCKYQIAAGYGDLINYYQQVLAGLDSASKINTLAQAEFILISMETESGKVVQAISPEWILPESFTLVQQESSYTIKVYTHAGATVQTVLQLLRDNGYTCQSLS